MSVVVEVSAHTFAVPRECACCGAAAEVHIAASYTRVRGKRVIHETTRSVSFPYCRRCESHIARWRAAGRIPGALVALGLFVGVFVSWAMFAAMALGGLALFLWQRRRARAMCAPSCACPHVPVMNLGWSGTVTSFYFESDGYAVRFAEANARKLINVSMRLQRLLDERASRMPAEVTPPRALPVRVRATPPPLPKVPADPVLEWIARIEGFKGAEARRNALKRALDEIRQPAARRELILAVTRIEVTAVLDKVDGLASQAAKRRHLEKVIADIKADEVPDELQADELEQLEQRLTELGPS